MIESHVNKKVVGEFVLSVRLKISPFPKEEVIFKAKPARAVVKIRPLKKLKDMAL